MADTSDLSKPWKIDVDILYSPQYEGLSEGLLHRDADDRLWLPLQELADKVQELGPGRRVGWLRYV